MRFSVFTQSCVYHQHPPVQNLREKKCSFFSSIFWFTLCDLNLEVNRKEDGLYETQSLEQGRIATDLNQCLRVCHLIIG